MRAFIMSSGGCVLTVMCECAVTLGRCLLGVIAPLISLTHECPVSKLPNSPSPFPLQPLSPPRNISLLLAVSWKLC